jgi:adenylate kinase family enzyme
VERVVVMGRGGAGKSTAATRLGQLTGLPVIELDKHFWQPGLIPTPAPDWIRIQRTLARPNRWIMDGDLGPYDAPAPRLAGADTVLVLDFSLARCAYRAARRSPERADFWRWVIGWRRRARPALLDAIATHATTAEVHILRTPRQLRRLLSAISPRENPPQPNP